MSENLHELCSSLVEEFYGKFHAKIFSQLAYHGRLSASAIAHKSRLPLKQVKCGLAALVQSRLIHHHTTLDGLSTYQANSNSTYNLMRYGRLVDLVQKQVGKYGALVISEALVLGFASLAELEARTLETLSTNQSKSTNGDFGDDEPEPELARGVRTAIEALLRLKFLVNIRSAHFQTPFDIRQDAELHLKRQGRLPSTKGKKGLDDLEAVLNNEVRDRTTTDKSEYGFTPDILPEKKRSLDDIDDGRASKKQKNNNGTSVKTNGYTGMHSASVAVTDALVVYVSFSNLISNTRNHYLSNRAKRILGIACSEVLSEALSQITNTEQWPSTLEEGWVDVSQLQMAVNHARHRNKSNGHHENGLATVNGTHINEEDELTEDRMTYNEVDRSLALLADSEFDFMQGAYGKEWKIHKESLDEFVRQHEILRLMGDRLGPLALRIVRMLIDKGKLDEKALQEMALLGAKDLRQILAQLKQMGYIDLQEVPRESQRLPMRTIFLWFHDSERVQKVLLDSLYKTMARLLQRLRVQRGKLSSTLEKLERSDVRGNEEHVMSAAELKVLRRWQRTEQWILGELARLDESVILLRDL